ncbi:MAG: hypothetical protein WC615_01590 [Mucilaginibacter sp.]|jgi:hypothetical protein|uniref:hypothetical protein n=1 Tax=Mucilaginibacter sp. TaxID=1882438 RepID=UPI003562474A
MVPYLYDPAFIEHNDLVGIFYGAESVGDYDDGLSDKEFCKVVYNCCFIVGIKATGSFIKK